jgi:hypothetical protein
MTIICYLLLAHFLIDWCWQTDFIAQNKHRMWQIMFAHCAAWSLGIGAVLTYCGLFAWWKLAMLFIGHWIEDLWKAKKVACINETGIGSGEFQLSGYSIQDFDKWKMKYFSKLLNIDQGFHILQLLICLVF